MQPERSPASTAAALACLAIALLPAAVRDQLAYQPQAIASGQLWRLWTAHFVHFSTMHAVSDAIVLYAVGALAEPLVGSLTLALVFALTPPLMSLLLPLAAPLLADYRGASGLAVMLAVVAASALWPAAGRWRVAIMLPGAAFAAKTWAEARGVPVGISALPQGVAVAWQAHALGAALGAIVAVMLALFRPPAAALATHSANRSGPNTS